MNSNTQNTKIAAITEKNLIVGIDVGSVTYYARAFDWRNYEYTKKPLEFSNTEVGFLTFKAWVEDVAEKYGKTAVIPGMEPTTALVNEGRFSYEEILECWAPDDPDMPKWLKQYIP